METISPTASGVTQEYCARCKGPVFEEDFTFAAGEDKKICRACHDTIEPACPNCGVRFKALPSKDAVCPTCHGEVYVRRNQNIFSSLLLKRDQALTLNRLVRLRPFGITEADYREAQSEMGALLSRDVRANDVLLAVIEKTLKRNHTDLTMQSDLYLVWADLLRAEGEDPMEKLQQWARLKLVDWKATGWFKWAKIQPCELCKPTLKEEDMEAMSIDDALAKLPAPHRHTTRQPQPNVPFEMCECDYVPVPRAHSSRISLI